MNYISAAESERVVRVTQGPNHHFFSYYDKRQWDPSGRYLLTMQTDFVGRSPGADDVARFGMIDLHDNHRFIKLGTTRAWCWQQGAMLQWLPGSSSSVIYNDRVADRFVSVILDVKTGERRTLPRPIYTVSDDARWALSLNFSRLARTRPGYGYNGLPDVWADDPNPAEDGIYFMDLETGNHRLVVDIQSLAEHAPLESMEGAEHWVNHLLFNPSGDRFIFLHRWRQGTGRFITRFCTANKDGSERHVFPIEHGSHFIWRDDHHILVWAQTKEFGGHYYLLTDQTDDLVIVGDGVLTKDGHCTYSPDQKWVLTDEYPDKNGMRPLILFNVEKEERIDLAHFYSPMTDNVEFRCDLHPRWSPDGRWVCVDSDHEGIRQVYLVDVADIVGGQ